MSEHEKSKLLIRINEAISKGESFPPPLVDRLKASLEDDANYLPSNLGIWFDGTSEPYTASKLFLSEDGHWLHLGGEEGWSRSYIRISSICMVRINE